METDQAEINLNFCQLELSVGEKIENPLVLGIHYS